MDLSKDDIRWIITLIVAIVMPLITEWLKAWGFFNRKHH